MFQYPTSFGKIHPGVDPAHKKMSKKMIQMKMKYDTALNQNLDENYFDPEEKSLHPDQKKNLSQDVFNG